MLAVPNGHADLWIVSALLCYWEVHSALSNQCYEFGHHVLTIDVHDLSYGPAACSTAALIVIICLAGRSENT